MPTLPPDTMIMRITTAYGLQPERIHPSQTGYRNHSYALDLPNEETANLIIYKSEPGIIYKIRDANRVGDYGAAHGLPARRTLDARILQLRDGDHPKYAALYHYLPGQTIPWEAYTMDHIKLLGLGMSRMHTALSTLPPAPPLHDQAAVVYRQITQRMQTYFSRTDIRAAMRTKLGLQIEPTIFDELTALLRACRHLPGQQALHLDFVRGNILFSPAAQYPYSPLQHQGLAITGILDFEKTASGHPMFDIARSLAFLYVDCASKTPAQINRYFLDSGYNKRGSTQIHRLPIHINGQSYDLLAKLTEVFLLHDFYKFLRHNPYESLEQNHHFRRTRCLLQELLPSYFVYISPKAY